MLFAAPRLDDVVCQQSQTGSGSVEILVAAPSDRKSTEPQGFNTENAEAGVPKGTQK